LPVKRKTREYIHYGYYARGHDADGDIYIEGEALARNAADLQDIITWMIENDWNFGRVTEIKLSLRKDETVEDDSEASVIFLNGPVPSYVDATDGDDDDDDDVPWTNEARPASESAGFSDDYFDEDTSDLLYNKNDPLAIHLKEVS
jgi:hypothetical protein